ncbi:MAG: hypothetical protein A2682_01830 [Candidatus Terrybacteria bacterium RIFCSPHIGHO2_01_FULL_58_15]|uniref:2-oxoacid:acceptor oxidoreductase subunit alpha n=1 Tax=Terrybacteria sp. (strain RIFCSPHIGHO2_01_FULL_58_15) TaxID=1802363 RepID=A0A1G2PNU6_TERXR|nr:MAG: hypothetical protein A2682_01830 [Candidatus Terrybacteria bacterium RIFCSPHIGHO2_01_FULL_58_15]
MREPLMVCVAGRAGDGSYSTASVFAKTLQRLGYYVHEQRDVLSNIKGKPSAFLIVVGPRQVFGVRDATDILIAFDGESFREHIGDVRAGGTVIVDCSQHNPSPRGQPIHLTADEGQDLRTRRITLFSLPMAEMAREIVRDPIMRNMIGLGVLASAMGVPRRAVADFIEKQFGQKKRGAEIVLQNLQCFDAGQRFAREHDAKAAQQFRARHNPGRLYLLGDEAIALGALAGGCRFFAGYPITPASEIFEYMMDHMREFGGAAVQATSELEAIQLIEGAAYAGARAMTATSGPGFSLMQEAISGSGTAETPIVITLIQRGGPGTGLPTRTAQEDLLEAVFGGHGEFPRIVISPATPEECFLFGAEAFNLAERYQCLVILFSEQCVGQGRFTVPALPIDSVRVDRGKRVTLQEARAIADRGGRYQRYAVTDDGISPRAFPGTPGITVFVNSNEHDVEGYSIEDPQTRIVQVDKRQRKIATMLREDLLPASLVTGSRHSRIGFVGYGGMYGPISDAMATLARDHGIATKFLRLRTLWPFPADEVRRFADSCDLTFVVEQNRTGQLRRLIQMEAIGPSGKLRSILRYDGMPFRQRGIVEAAREEVAS